MQSLETLLFVSAAQSSTQVKTLAWVRITHCSPLLMAQWHSIQELKIAPTFRLSQPFNRNFENTKSNFSRPSGRFFYTKYLSPCGRGRSKSGWGVNQMIDLGIMNLNLSDLYPPLSDLWYPSPGLRPTSPTRGDVFLISTSRFLSPNQIISKVYFHYKRQ